jgi:hypothetical protein
MASETLKNHRKNEMRIFVTNSQPVSNGDAGEQIYEKNLFTSLFTNGGVFYGFK